MKLLFRFSLLLLLLAGLTACKKDDPLKGKLRYKVALHVTGENLGGLGAGMEYSSVRSTLTDPHPGPSGRDAYAVRVDSTYSLGEFGWYDTIEASIFMRNVNCNAATHPGPGSWLKLEMLVNGVVIDRAELNSASTRNLSCAAPYLVLALASGGSDWDD